MATISETRVQRFPLTLGNTKVEGIYIRKQGAGQTFTAAAASDTITTRVYNPQFAIIIKQGTVGSQIGAVTVSGTTLTLNNIAVAATTDAFILVFGELL